MTEIRFYHLQHMRLEQALPGILSQAYKRGMRAVVKMRDAESLQQMDSTLWTFQPQSFLPHGMDGAVKDAADKQPIWLTLKDENPNGASLLILAEGAESDILDRFELVCEIFDGMNEAALAAAREKWRRLKADYKLTYFQQTEKGGWEEKAST